MLKENLFQPSLWFDFQHYHSGKYHISKDHSTVLIMHSDCYYFKEFEQANNEKNYADLNLISSHIQFKAVDPW